jgi:hypothetical protein
MKNQTLLLATLCLSLGLAAVPAHAQTGGVKVKVPFNFVVANRTLPEGEYLIASAKDKVFVQNSHGETVAMVLSNAVSGRAVGRTGQVVFQCYDQHCFLSELWSPTRDAGRQLLKCQWEKEVAKRETAKYFALIGAADNHQR